MTVILVVLAAWLGASAGFVLGAAWVYRRNLWQTGYARIEMARLHIELERMRQALEQVGICPTCLHEYTHDITEPFAHCGCPGTIEWTGPLPLIFRLRHGL